MDLKPENLVSPNPSLMGVNTLDGRTVVVERLGPGVVREVRQDGGVLVHWVGANVDALMDQEDLLPQSPDAHLLTIIRLDAHASKVSTHHKVVTSAGLEYNWTVEIRHNNVVRAIRSDNWIWTFDWNPIVAQMTIRHNRDYPPTGTADAEALTVAELAIR